MLKGLGKSVAVFIRDGSGKNVGNVAIGLTIAIGNVDGNRSVLINYDLDLLGVNGPGNSVSKCRTNEGVIRAGRLRIILVHLADVICRCLKILVNVVRIYFAALALALDKVVLVGRNVVGILFATLALTFNKVVLMGLFKLCAAVVTNVVAVCINVLGAGDLTAAKTGNDLVKLITACEHGESESENEN